LWTVLHWCGHAVPRENAVPPSNIRTGGNSDTVAFFRGEKMLYNMFTDS